MTLRRKPKGYLGIDHETIGSDIVAVIKILKLPDLQERFDQQGVSAGDMSRDQLAAFIKAETVKWTKVAKDSGASAD